MTIRLEGLGDVACREEANIAWADIHSSEIKLDFGRCNNDHNTALKYLRRQSENNAVPLIELSQKTSINEIQHAWYGPEYFWWNPLPGHPKDTVMFNRSFKDFLKSWDMTSKQTFFGDGNGGEHTLKACFFLSLPNSYDHKRSRNEKAANATYFKADGGGDNKAGFAFVREDGAVLLVCPRWYDINIDAYWLSKGFAHRTSG